MIASWKRQAFDMMVGIFSGAGDAAKSVSESEMEKLRAKIGQLAVERVFLAKAIGAWAWTEGWTPRRTGYFRPDGGAMGLIAVSGR